MLKKTAPALPALVRASSVPLLDDAQRAALSAAPPAAPAKRPVGKTAPGTTARKLPAKKSATATIFRDLPVFALFPPWVRLDTDIPLQEQTNWCWAATSLGIHRYYERENQTTQCQAVNMILPVTNACTNPTASTVNKAWYLDDAISDFGNLREPALARSSRSPTSSPRSTPAARWARASAGAAVAGTSWSSRATATRRRRWSRSTTPSLASRT